MLPPLQYRKIVDFLEDRWGTSVVRRKNEFYRANRQDRPVARLSSDSIVVAVIDQTTGNWHEIQTKVSEIELPKPIVVEQRIYRSLLYELVRASGQGVTRWINKFYGTATGTVLAELLSKDKIRVFETAGLLRSSGIISLEDYAAIKVPREQYFHLLDFLAQSGDDVRRVGNVFYSKKESKFLDSILRSLGSVSKSTTSYLKTKILTELVSPSTVRFPDGTTKKICDLVLSKRVFRTHLYFCNSCQSFIRIPYRTLTHKSQSGDHAVAYLSSSITTTSVTKPRTTKKYNKKFPELLYKFWGIEKGKLPRDKRKPLCATENQFHIIESQPASDTSFSQRPVSTTPVLLSAEITIDGHRPTNEERLLAYERLEQDRTANPKCKETSQESIGKEQLDGSVEQDPSGVGLDEDKRAQEKYDLQELTIDS